MARLLIMSTWNLLIVHNKKMGQNWLPRAVSVKRRTTCTVLSNYFHHDFLEQNSRVSMRPGKRIFQSLLSMPGKASQNYHLESGSTGCLLFSTITNCFGSRSLVELMAFGVKRGGDRFAAFKRGLSKYLEEKPTDH